MTIIAHYIVESLYQRRSKIWYLYTYRRMASSVVKSSCSSGALPETNRCTITTSCALTSSSISNMWHHLVNCLYTWMCICAHINIFKRLHDINWWWKSFDFFIIYIIYIMILNLHITQLSFTTVRILVEKFPIEISWNESIYSYISRKTSDITWFYHVTFLWIFQQLHHL